MSKCYVLSPSYNLISMTRDKMEVYLLHDPWVLHYIHYVGLKWLTSWLLFMVYICDFVTFPLVSWVRSGT